MDREILLSYSVIKLTCLAGRNSFDIRYLPQFDLMDLLNRFLMGIVKASKILNFCLAADTRCLILMSDSMYSTYMVGLAKSSCIVKAHGRPSQYDY